MGFEKINLVRGIKFQTASEVCNDVWEGTAKSALIVRMVSRLSRKFTSEKVFYHDDQASIDFDDVLLVLFE